MVPDEVIIVLGPDQSESLSALKSISSPFPMKIYQSDKRNLCWSRNIGLKFSQYEIVAFIDDDAVPEPNWLKNLKSPFSDPKIGLVGGWTRFQGSLKFQHQNQVVTESFRVRPLAENEKPGKHEFLSPLGANFAIRRSVGIHLNGFDNYLEWWGDEADFAIRMTKSEFLSVFEPSAVVHHFQASSEFRKSVPGAVNVRTPWKSRSYLMARHSNSIKYLGTVIESDFEISRQSLEWARINNALGKSDFNRLIQDIRDGIREGSKSGVKGRRLIHSGLDQIDGNLIPEHESTPRLKKEKYSGLAPLFVYREEPGITAGGITNWITEMCRAFGEKGVPSVYVCQQGNLKETSVRYKDGYWIFQVGIELYYNLEFARQTFPTDLQTFGIQARNLVYVISEGFSISDIVIPTFEGLGNLFIGDNRLVTTLHTSTKESLENHPNLPFDVLTQIRIDMINKLEEEIIESSPRLVANSHQIAKKLGLGGSPKVKVIPHGIRVSNPEEIQIRPLTYKKTPRIAFIGRWEPRKGTSYLPEIISKILDCGLQVTIVGGDPFGQRASALKKLKETHNSNLIVLGIVENDQLQAIYKDSDAVIIPSIYESFGLVAIEALAAGCGVVAFSGSGIEESVKNCINAEFSEVGDVEDFAQKTMVLAKKLFENPKLRNESRNYVAEKFSLNQISEDFLDYLRASTV
jgi:glycogen(starch) synthase